MEASPVFLTSDRRSPSRELSGENPTLRLRLSWKALGIAALAAVFAVPALAGEYLVIQDSATKKCTVVIERPTTSTTVVIGPTAFAPRSDAEGSIRTTKTCVVD